MTTQPPRMRILAGIASLVLLGLSASTALAATPDPTLPPAWPQGRVLTYRWAAGAVPPSAMRTAINGAASAATSSRGSRAPSYVYKSSAANAVSYGTSNPCGVNGLACFSRNPAGGYWHLWLRENGHRYDWGTLRWCEMTGSPNGCYQAKTITLDELGHVAGLNHHVNLPNGSDYSDAVVQTYSHARPQTGWNAGVFGRCDVATLQQVYDVGSWTTRYSTCLDVPTSLSLTASSTSVGSRTAVTFTATLRSGGAGRLSDNPMSGRVVVLQWRSGTSWADLKTMTAGSGAGTYTASFTPRVSQGFRAIFRKPSNEGVRASASTEVSVRVNCTMQPCPLVAGPIAQAR